MKSATNVLKNNNITLSDPSKQIKKDAKIFLRTDESGRKVEVDKGTIAELLLNKKQKKSHLATKLATSEPEEREKK